MLVLGSRINWKSATMDFALKFGILLANLILIFANNTTVIRNYGKMNPFLNQSSYGYFRSVKVMLIAEPYCGTVWHFLFRETSKVFECHLCGCKTIKWSAVELIWANEVNLDSLLSYISFQTQFTKYSTYCMHAFVVCTFTT